MGLGPCAKYLMTAQKQNSEDSIKLAIHKQEYEPQEQRTRTKRQDKLPKQHYFLTMLRRAMMVTI